MSTLHLDRNMSISTLHLAYDLLPMTISFVLNDFVGCNYKIKKDMKNKPMRQSYRESHRVWDFHTHRPLTKAWLAFLSAQHYPINTIF